MSIDARPRNIMLILGTLIQNFDIGPSAGFPRGRGSGEEAVSRAEAWCLGGSFLTPERPTYTAGRVCLALEVSAGHRASDLGLRCVTEAEGYLRGLPGGEDLSAAERERVARVGQRWGPSAATLLTRLQREGAGGAWVDALLAGASR